jgi:hypothetical protein
MSPFVTDKHGYLEPVHCNQKSFYKRALVMHNGDVYTLRSYFTTVAVFNSATRELTTNGWYSMTTGRHIKEFAYQCGFHVGGKAQLDNGVRVWK